LNPTLDTIVLTIHVLGAAVWFGPKLFWPRRLRTGLASAESAKVVVPAIARELRVTSAGAVLVFATGLALIFLHGGFKAVPPRIHAGLGLTLVAFTAGLAVSLPALVALWRHVEQGDLEKARPLVKRIAIGEAIEHTCWLATLVLMVWRIPPS